MPSRLFCLKVQRSKCNLQCLNFQCKPLIEFHKNNERNINKAHKNGALMKLPLLMMLLETACLQSTFIILPDNYFCNSWQGIQREHLLFMQSLPRYLFFLAFLPLTLSLSLSLLVYIALSQNINCFSTPPLFTSLCNLYLHTVVFAQ